MDDGGLLLTRYGTLLDGTILLEWADCSEADVIVGTASLALDSPLDVWLSSLADSELDMPGSAPWLAAEEAEDEGAAGPVGMATDGADTLLSVKLLLQLA